MKRRILGWAVALFFLTTTAAVAQSMEGMDHGAHQSSAQNGMEMGGTMIVLGNDTQEGITAMAHLRDIQAAMAKLGMDKTHHFMVMFKDMASGKDLSDGLVAVKVVDPSGKKHEAVKLMAMDGSFGADVALSQKGTYRFEVGAKFANGVKRQFSFQYTKP